MTNPTANAPTTLGAIFDREMSELRWIAEVIIGDAQAAEICVASARSRTEGALYVAPEWRDRWIKRCVARESVESNRLDIARFAPRRTHSSRFQSLPALTPWDTAKIRACSPAEICDALNPFERAALILHGYLGFSTHDCALLVDSHWSSIEQACSAASLRLLGPFLHVKQTVVTGNLEVLA